MVEKNNKIWYILGGVIVIILAIVSFNYVSQQNQSTKSKENNQITSIIIKSISYASYESQEVTLKDCSLCNKGYFDTKNTNYGIICLTDNCNYKSNGGICDTCSDQTKEDVCSDYGDGTLYYMNLNYDINSNNPVGEYRCRVYNNGVPFPKESNGAYPGKSGENIIKELQANWKLPMQTYKVCCSSSNVQEVCSQEYTFSNPC